MKKIFSIFMFFLVLGILNPVFSNCSRDEKEIVSGAACSIADLNSHNKNDNSMEKSKVIVVKERDLRPVRIPQESFNTEKTGCFWGQCLINEIFNRNF